MTSPGDQNSPTTTALWVGGYTADSEGNGRGIGRIELDGRGAVANFSDVAEADSPSFLASHPTLPVLYAVAEAGEQVRAFHVDDAQTKQGLSPLGEPRPAGPATCHVAVSPDGATLVATCWGSGEVYSYALDETGRIGEPHRHEPSADPYANAGDPPITPGAPRQSRAHFALFLPDGRLLTTDLGHDLVRSWSVQESRLLSEAELVLPHGSGPRHLALGADGAWAHLATEYSVEVFTLDIADGNLTVSSACPATRRALADGDTGAHITFTGNAVQVGIRGSHQIAVAALGENGSLRELEEKPCGGQTPRNHLITDGADGRVLHVACQDSDEVVSFTLDDRGVPGDEIGRVAVGSPSCLVS